MKFRTISRSAFIARFAIPALAVGLSGPRLFSVALAASRSPAISRGPQAFAMTLRVNAREYTLPLEPRATLLDTLRDRLALTGTKKGCDQGTCGACTVLVDGKRVNSCLILAVMAQGKSIETIEGLARGDELHPMQAAFIEHDAFQCGYCTSGQIMSAVAFLAEKRSLDAPNVREWMSGNICRCGAYPNIVAAIQAVGGGRA